MNSPHLLLQVVSLFIRVHWSLPKGCCITCNVSIEGQISKGMGKRVHCVGRVGAFGWLDPKD